MCSLGDYNNPRLAPRHFDFVVRSDRADVLSEEVKGISDPGMQILLKAHGGMMFTF